MVKEIKAKEDGNIKLPEGYVYNPHRVEVVEICSEIEAPVRTETIGAYGREFIDTIETPTFQVGDIIYLSSFISESITEGKEVYHFARYHDVLGVEEK